MLVTAEETPKLILVEFVMETVLERVIVIVTEMFMIVLTPVEDLL